MCNCGGTCPTCSANKGGQPTMVQPQQASPVQAQPVTNAVPTMTFEQFQAGHATAPVMSSPQTQTVTGANEIKLNDPTQTQTASPTPSSTPSADEWKFIDMDVWDILFPHVPKIVWA